MTEPLFPIDINFRGPRTYLHSASIFDALVAKTGARSNIKLTFRRVLDKPIAAFPFDADLPAQFEADGVKLSIGEVEGDEPGREPYDEEARLAGAEVEGNSLTTTVAHGTPIERFVAMNKRLIETLKKPDGKVIFVSCTMSELPADSDPLRVELVRSGAGLHQSVMYRGDQRLGEMIFATLKPRGFAK